MHVPSCMFPPEPNRSTDSMYQRQRGIRPHDTPMKKLEMRRWCRLDLHQHYTAAPPSRLSLMHTNCLMHNWNQPVFSRTVTYTPRPHTFPSPVITHHSSPPPKPSPSSCLLLLERPPGFRRSSVGSALLSCCQPPWLLLLLALPA